MIGTPPDDLKTLKNGMKLTPKGEKFSLASTMA